MCFGLGEDPHPHCHQGFFCLPAPAWLGLWSQQIKSNTQGRLRCPMLGHLEATQWLCLFGLREGAATGRDGCWSDPEEWSAWTAPRGLTQRPSHHEGAAPTRTAQPHPWITPVSSVKCQGQCSSCQSRPSPPPPSVICYLRSSFWGDAGKEPHLPATHSGVGAPQSQGLEAE